MFVLVKKTCDHSSVSGNCLTHHVNKQSFIIQLIKYNINIENSNQTIIVGYFISNKLAESSVCSSTVLSIIMWFFKFYLTKIPIIII